ncbi:MAG: energy-coupling factor transporter transmembrane protein EcfT [Actinomycetota bacterium]|nr:energy-coupling factor transporter transmembrane protein EcfT [Actinomycetota bacterium]
MEDFELLRNVTLGQYLPTGSFIHRMDPRAKLLAATAVVAAVTFNYTYVGNVILLVVVLVILMLARIPLGYAASGIKPAIPVMVALAVMQLLFFGRSLDPDSPVVLDLGFQVVTAATVKLVIISALRFVELILLTTAITFSTTVTELAHGFEGLLQPLRKLKVPAHELALVLTIALRFVPTFAQELERIMKAQASRGARVGAGSRWNFVRRARSLLPLVVPLFTIALQRAEELILAMEARCYVGGSGRTHLMELAMTRRDVVAVAVSVGFAVVMLIVRFPA